MKKVLTVICVFVVVICGVLIARNIIIKASVEKGVEIVTGLKLNIGGLDVGIFKPVVDIEKLTLSNPPSFSDRTMIDIPEVYVNYDLMAILGGKVHLPEVRLGLNEFVVVKNANGELNLDSLKNVQKQKEGKASEQKASGKAPQVKIDLLKLDIGKVIYKDYSKGGAPVVKEFNVNIHESYTNVDNLNSLANLILVKTLTNTSIANLTNFDLKGMQGTVGGLLSGARNIPSTAVVTDTVKSAKNTLKGLIKNPFGSSK